MCNEMARKGPRKGITIPELRIKLGDVDRYKYLGRILIPQNDMTEKINQRVTAGWRKVSHCSHFFFIRGTYQPASNEES